LAGHDAEPGALICRVQRGHAELGTHAQAASQLAS
jgi:hypothetical protein